MATPDNKHEHPIDDGVGEALPPMGPPIATGLYRHYKGGRYEVVGVVRHSESLEEMVLYRALYGENGLWVRPRAMFAEQVEVGGAWVDRFARVVDSDSDRDHASLGAAQPIN